MRWILTVFCGALGVLSMPRQEPGHIIFYGVEDFNEGNLDSATISPVKNYIREELFNSEASPALPPLPTTSASNSRGERAKPTSIISVTIPITTQRNDSVPRPFTTTASATKDSIFTVSAASSPSTFILPIRGANPSVQLLPPLVLPETPTTISPRNIHDIPLSLVSLSGNSGATTSSEEDATSREENPEQMGVDFTKFRYHVETGQLVKIGSTGKGICPQNMRFFAVPGHAKNGACDCDYYQCSRPLIYSPERHQCYYAWSQGPCKKGEWFVFDKDLRKRGHCASNPCPPEVSNGTTIAGGGGATSSSDYFFLNPEDETCYEAGTQGYCTDNDERLLIFPGEPIPKCRKFTLCYPLTVPQELQCIFGNKYFVESEQC